MDWYFVIYGYLFYWQILKVVFFFFKYIIWLWYLVDWVILNYYYYWDLVFFVKQKRNFLVQFVSIEDFIECFKCRNKMSQYLEGIDFEVFFFVGFQEQFKKDVVRFG